MNQWSSRLQSGSGLGQELAGHDDDGTEENGDHRQCHAQDHGLGSSQAVAALAYPVFRAGMLLDLYRASGNQSGHANTLHVIGWHHVQLGEYQEGLIHCEQALAMFEDIGERRGQAGTWHSIGYANHHLRDYARATACHERALDLCVTSETDRTKRWSSSTSATTTSPPTTAKPPAKHGSAG